MRVLMTLIVCAFVMVGGGWARAAVPAPPTCSPGQNAVAVQTPGTSPGHPLYTRWCGPATVLVHLHGASFRLHGGQCEEGGGFLVRVGLIANAPAPPAEWVGLFLHDPRAAHPGTLKLAETATGTVYARIQLRAPELLIAGGTITIGKSMRAGTFAFRLRDGTRVTGSWTCG